VWWLAWGRGLAVSIHRRPAAIAERFGVVPKVVHLLVEVGRLDHGREHRLDREAGRQLIDARLRGEQDGLAGRLDPQPDAVLQVLCEAEQRLELAERECDGHVASRHACPTAGLVGVQVGGRDGHLGAYADVLLIVQADRLGVVAQARRARGGGRGVSGG
jgi:hypothetical protein